MANIFCITEFLINPFVWVYIMDWKKLVNEVHYSFENAQSNGVDVWNPPDSRLMDYKSGQKRSYALSFKSAVTAVVAAARKSQDEDLLGLALQLQEARDPKSVRDVIGKLASLAPDENDVDSLSVPEEIAEEVSADLIELQKCFNAGCYRSCIILCGRVLEAALHRKYFEVTGKDLLETSPGIGLGNLIAKLGESGNIDPGLGNQIHLINQVRISSVHKKSEVFIPSRDQTRAIMLYTKDIVKKIFQ